MKNYTPQDYFDLYGSKRPNSNIVQTYRIRKKTNNTPNYPGSLDLVVYLVLFEGKFLKKSELYAYTYLPEYYDIPERYYSKPGKLEISGVYKGVNLFIENPEVANSLGNCITNITVNGAKKPGGTGSKKVEIDFNYFDVKIGDDITIVIDYDPSCKIDVINPEAVLGTKDDNVQDNTIAINEKYKKRLEEVEKRLEEETAKVKQEQEEINYARHKITRKPDNEITIELKTELSKLDKKYDDLVPQWNKRINDIKEEINQINESKNDEINNNSNYTIRSIERLVIAENLPINLTEVAIDKMGRNFDNLLLKALKIKDLEVIDGNFYTTEDLTTPVPNESVVELYKLFVIADEIVEEVIKNFKYMDSPADYEIIQYPWDPNDVPPEELEPDPGIPDLLDNSDEMNNWVNSINQMKNSYTIRARGEYSVKVNSNSDKIKLTGLDGKFFLLPDGERVELGELTLVKKENTNDPYIISILSEEYERQDELSDEYLEDEYVGEGLGTTLGVTTGDYVAPPPTVYSTSSSSSSSSSNSNLSFDGKGYEPLQKLIFSGESGSYDSLNGGMPTKKLANGTKVKLYDADGRQCTGATKYKTRFGKSSMESTISEVIANAKKLSGCSGGAMGRYQNMPIYIRKRALDVGLNPDVDLYNEVNQDKMGTLLIDDMCGNYIKGKNGGNQADLEYAVIRLGGCWTSLPTVKRGNVVIGSVVDGSGSGGSNTSAANNGGNTNKTVGAVVKVLIKTRHNLAPDKKPSFIPSYATDMWA